MESFLITSCSSTIPLDKTDTIASDTVQVPLPGTQPTELDTRQENTDTQQTEPDTHHDNTSTSDTSADNPPEDEPAGTVVHEPRTDFFIGTAPEDSRKLLVIKPTGIIQNDTFIFYRDTDYGLHKRNLKTLEESPVCCDPYCNHWQDSKLDGTPEEACPFNFVSNVYFLYGSKVYYLRSYKVSTDTDGAAVWYDVFSSYNYQSGEYHAIEKIAIPYNTRVSLSPARESYQLFYGCYLYGSYAYYFQYRPVNDKAESAADYRRTLVRMDLTTDKTEDLMAVDGVIPNNAAICAIRDRVIYLTTSDGLWAWDPAAGTIRELMTLEAGHTQWLRNGDTAVYNGCLYIMTEYFPDGLNPTGPFRLPVSRLNRINLETGEAQRLTDVCPDYVFFRDEAIYIVPRRGYLQETEYWRLNVNPWKESTNPHKKYMRHILKTDMNGENMETIGYCNSDDMVRQSGLILAENGILGDRAFFEFSSGITYTSDGEVYDDPKNGIINEPESAGSDHDIPGSWHSGEETWW